MSKFSQTPTIRMSRSRFDMSHSVKTAFNVGELVPFMVQEIYPGDTFNVKSTNVIRTLSPFIRPVMDNLFLDTYFFFVPNRLVFDKWQNVMGENTDSYWTEQENVKVPMLMNDFSEPMNSKSIGCYFGLPIESQSANQYLKVNALPFRDYALIWNEWFRDENLQAPVYIDKSGINPDDDSNIFPVLNRRAWDVNNIFGGLAPVNKFHDYFTSALPGPQKGDDVSIPLSKISPSVYPKAGANLNDLFATEGDLDPMSFVDEYNQPVTGKSLSLGSYLGYNDSTYQSITGYVVPNNLVLDTNGMMGTINDLRLAFQFQKMLEKDARGGTRYTEYLLEHFGVVSPDSRLQRPEFLGGKRIPLNLTQVTQTSQSTEDSPLGQVSAYSLTSGRSGYSKGFVEHGFVLGLMCVRYHHTYQQGVEKFWTREQRLDYYDPVFANIGEQPVYRSELDFNHTQKIDDKTIFGWQEAWADLRYKPSMITGDLKSDARQMFDVWHFADYYDPDGEPPVLNSTFIRENPDFVDRTLSVPSDTAPHFIIDIYNDVKATRVLPVYSIPGLVDHH